MRSEYSDNNLSQWTGDREPLTGLEKFQSSFSIPFRFEYCVSNEEIIYNDMGKMHHILQQYYEMENEIIAASR